MSGGTRVYGSDPLPENTLGVPNITVSTSAPTSTQGQNGDIWIQYTA